MKIRCRKLIKTSLGYKSCYTTKGHPGSHTPNLLGERIGHFTVVSVGKPFFEKDRRRKTTWVVKSESGLLKTVRANTIFTGGFSGSRPLHGDPFSNFDKNGKLRPEFRTVQSHYYWIFTNPKSMYRYYKGMQFFKGWDPKKGGSFNAGMRWTIDNLGERPDSDWSLDIIKREKGFVPGNLRWATKSEQSNNRSHHDLKRYSDLELRVELRSRGFRVIKI